MPKKPKSGAKTAIEARGLHKSFGGHEVLKGVDLAVVQGSLTALVGPSGCGKSTLLRCLNALEQLDQGTLRVGGLEMGSARALQRKVGMVFQSFHLFPHLTVLENLVLPQVVVAKSKRDEAAHLAQNLLAKVGLEKLGHRHPHQLSGGQQQRAAIARALAMRPEVLLLDEPTSALDPGLAREVLSVLAELRREGMTQLLVTHELSFAHHFADDLVFMDEGVVVEAGPAKKVLDRPKHPKTKKFLSHFHRPGRRGKR